MGGNYIEYLEILGIIICSPGYMVIVFLDTDLFIKLFKNGICNHFSSCYLYLQFVFVYVKFL